MEDSVSGSVGMAAHPPLTSYPHPHGNANARAAPQEFR